MSEAERLVREGPTTVSNREQLSAPRTIQKAGKVSRVIEELKTGDSTHGPAKRVRLWFQSRAQKYLMPIWAPTDRQAWDLYARAHRFDSTTGNEWNRPDLLGLPVEADELIPYLDREVFDPLLKQADPETLLEIGPGGGRVTGVLLPKCRHLIAADISSQMIRNLRWRFRASSSLSYVLLDGQGLTGVQDDSVDAVVSYDVFVHLTHWDIFNYLREIRRVLRDGGVAILHHANTISDLGWDHFAKEVATQVGKKKLPQTFTPMTPELMQVFAQKADLELIDCLTTTIPRDAISVLRAW